jgi:hypothetical protein
MNRCGHVGIHAGPCKHKPLGNLSLSMLYISLRLYLSSVVSLFGCISLLLYLSLCSLSLWYLALLALTLTCMRSLYVTQAVYSKAIHTTQSMHLARTKPHSNHMVAITLCNPHNAVDAFGTKHAAIQPYGRYNTHNAQRSRCIWHETCRNPTLWSL